MSKLTEENRDLAAAKLELYRELLQMAGAEMTEVEVELLYQLSMDPVVQERVGGAVVRTPAA
jgi:hypothetical protein